MAAPISKANKLPTVPTERENGKNGNTAKYYTYPKASISWNLTQSGLIKTGLFDNVKLRAAYGQANNVPAYGSKFTSLAISNIQGNPGVVANNQEGQPGIEPERQEVFETGADFSLLGGRLGLGLLITTILLTTS